MHRRAQSAVISTLRLKNKKRRVSMSRAYNSPQIFHLRFLTRRGALTALISVSVN